MDNSIVEQWSTPAAALAAVTIGGIALAIVGAVGATDPAGRVLVLVAAVGCLIIAGLAARHRPRLAVHADGSLSIGRLAGRNCFATEDLQRIRVVRYPRLGRRVAMLEIDVRNEALGERLFVFGRWDLGRSPDDVLEVLRRHGLVPLERD